MFKTCVRLGTICFVVFVAAFLWLIPLKTEVVSTEEVRYSEASENYIITCSTSLRKEYILVPKKDVKLIAGKNTAAVSYSLLGSVSCSYAEIDPELVNNYKNIIVTPGNISDVIKHLVNS